MRSVVLFGTAAALAAGAQITTYYDANGTHPQCSEASSAYMKDCVFKSDMFPYMLSDVPTLVDDGGSCASRGYEYVSADPVFTEFKLYWKGGAAAFQQKLATWGAAHPNLVPALNMSKAANKACAPASPAAPTAPAAPHDDTTSVVYDADPAGHMQCSQGPATYLQDCVQVSDLFNYIRLNKPTFVRNTTCEALGKGFELIGPDPVFPGFALYFVGGRAGFMERYGSWLGSHGSMSAFLNATRDANPACSL